MAIINFAIPNIMEKRINQIMNKKGFVSKAEFFRFAAIHLMDIIEKPILDNDERFKYLVSNLVKEVVKNYKGKKLSSAKEQLSDI